MSVSLTPTQTITSMSLVSGPKEKDQEPTKAPPSEEYLQAACDIHQSPVSITLGAASIFTLSLSLVLLIHFVDAHLAQMFVGLMPIVLLIHNDYLNFLGLGPGGTPSTVGGYIRICCLRLIALRDPFTAPKPDVDQFPKQGILHHQILPYRAGPRPSVAGIAPQRQLNQHGSRACYLALRRAMDKLSLRNPDKFGTELSCIEKHGLALFARHPLQTRCQGEICHVHDSEHSMHMALHPNDIKEVLTKGWGQRHPLAWQWRSFKMPVSRDFVMVYAPRDDQELQIVYNIINAAIWYTLAEEIDVRGTGR